MSDGVSGLIVILGSPNDEHGELSEMGRGRVQLGYETYRKRKDEGYRVLLTGGFGAHFNVTDHPNAFYASQMLLGLGVPAAHIVEFAESCNTVDDALQARPIVEKYGVGRLIVVSSDFHVGRVRFVFERVFPDRELDFLGAEYLATCGVEDRARLLAHEARELRSLQQNGESIVGGALKLDSWTKPQPRPRRSV